MFDGITFANPEYFYVMIAIPIFLAWYLFRQKKQYATLTIPTETPFKNAKISPRKILRHFPIVLRVAAFALLVMALARPQTSSSSQTVSTEGIDIIIAIDVSTSMLAEDFKPNRIEAAKKTAAEFVENRLNDRIGLVVFAGESFTLCPVTIDHAVLKNLLSTVKEGMVEDNTAIGMGLATAVSRLKDSKAKSKVVVLLTDGVNNAGFVAPLTAAEIAQTYGIRVYTIGVGTRGMAPYPIKTQFGTQYRNLEVQIDEDILKQIASMTDGKYFRATNNKVLQEVYTEIDELETTKVDVSVFKKYHEEFPPFVIIAFVLIFIELLFRYTYLRTLP